MSMSAEATHIIYVDKRYSRRLSSPHCAGKPTKPLIAAFLET